MENEIIVVREFIHPSFTFYKNMRNIIYEADILQDRIWMDAQKIRTNHIHCFEGGISNRNYSVNAENISKVEFIELLYTEKLKNIEHSDFENAIITPVELEYKRELFDIVINQEIIEWWERIKQIIYDKYNGTKNYNHHCQFARHLRNGAGHNGIKIDNEDEVDPIWKGLNLKGHRGKQIRDILTEADIFDFWIDFEMTEFSN